MNGLVDVYGPSQLPGQHVLWEVVMKAVPRIGPCYKGDVLD